MFSFSKWLDKRERNKHMRVLMVLAAAESVQSMRLNGMTPMQIEKFSHGGFVFGSIYLTVANIVAAELLTVRKERDYEMHPQIRHQAHRRRFYPERRTKCPITIQS